MSQAVKLLNRHEVSNLVKMVKAEILKEWEELSRAEVAAAEVQTRRALRDSLPEFLDHLADTLSCVDPKTQAEKNSEVAKEHAEDRASQPEYSLDEVIYEFHILRSVVIEKLDAKGAVDAEARRIIHEFIDRGIRKGAVKFTELEFKRKAAQTEEIALAKTEAEQANQAKSAFLTNMSHEIRTPLGAIMGFVELLQEPGLSKDESAKYLSIIDRNSHHLMNIIDHILDLAKVESGKLVVENIEFSLGEFLQDFSILMGLRARANGISFVIKTETELPEFVLSDPTRIRQILSNVVGNAVKFTEHGHVELTVGHENTRLYFRVTDTGRGISNDQRGRLFQAFAQADSSITRKFGGSGLGLVLTKKLTEALGGDFYLVESEIGKGSTFEASIAITSSKGTGKLSRDFFDKPQPVRTASDSSSVILEGYEILVVEDSQDNQELIKTLLQKTGAKTYFAGDGVEGVQKALRRRYDVILMDIQMPKMDGHQAVRELRSKGFMGPIVALTAHAMKEERLRAVESGFSHFLTKPIDRKDLTELLSRLYQSRKRDTAKESHV